MITRQITALLLGTTALVAIAEILIVVWHRRARKPYTFLDGLDHVAKLAAPFGLLVAVLAVMYTDNAQRATDVANAEMNRRAAKDAQEQRKLLQETVGVLHGVSSELKLNADASSDAAAALRSQRAEQIRQLGLKPQIKIRLSVLNLKSEVGPVVGIVDQAFARREFTVVMSKSDKELLLRVEVFNIGSANLQFGTVSLETASLDGGGSPVIAPDEVAGFKVPRDDDTQEVFPTTLPLPVSNLPLSRGGIEKLFKVHLSLPSVAESNERYFRLYVNFVGYADSKRGIFDIHVKREDEVDPELSKAALAMQESRYGEAFLIFGKLAKQGNSSAMFNLGFLYDEGLGVTANCARALDLYKQAMKNGLPIAMSNLGYMYETGHCVPKNYATAKDLYEQAAAAGGNDGMANLGWIYHQGHGVQPDYSQALEWYSRAAVLGNARAMNNIGTLFEDGKGVPRDMKVAKYWYEKAAENGNAFAMNRLGEMYQDGDGVNRDYEHALQLFEKAFRLRHAAATNHLGFMYQYGLGVKLDAQKARDLYEIASSKGDAAAKNNLGYLYQHGEGVTPDHKRAVTLYEEAIALGNAFALNNLGTMYEQGEGVKKDYAKALELYKKAAAHGVPKAMSNIASQYANGLVTGFPDYVKAREWYERAFAAGDKSAEEELRRLPTK